MHALSRVAALAAVASAIVAAGCAGGREAGPADDLVAVRTAVPGLPAGRRCSYLDEPRELPRLTDLASVHLAGNLDLWGFRGDPGDSTVLSIRYGPDAALLWVRAIHTTLAADRVAALEELLHESLTAPGREDWGVRLRVAGDGGGMRLLPSVVCLPQLDGHLPGIRLPFVGTSAEMRELLRARGRRVEALVSLDEEGYVMDVEIRHESGSRLFDQRVIDLARAATYLPQLHDGFGVASVYRLPFRFRNR